MLAFPLESELSSEIVSAANGADAKALLESKSISPDFIIANKAEEIANVGLAADKERGYVLCDDAEQKTPAAAPGLKFLGYALNQDLTANIVKLLKPSATAPVSEFTRLSTPLLLKMNPLASDIYIRLSPTHFVKLFQKNDHFDEGDLQKLELEFQIQTSELPANLVFFNWCLILTLHAVFHLVYVNKKRKTPLI